MTTAATIAIKSRFTSPVTEGRIVTGVSEGITRGLPYVTRWSGVYLGVRPSQWTGEPAHCFGDGIIGAIPQHCFAIPVSQFSGAAAPADDSPEAVYDAALTAWRETCGHEETSSCPNCVTYMNACDAFIAAIRARNAADEAEGWHPAGREAICTVCGQSFNPVDDSDLIHLQTTVPEGEKWGPDYTVDMPEGPERYCGGRGEMTGGWG